MRNEFKIVSIKGETFLYPNPVIKNKKYLLKVKSSLAQAFQEAFKRGLLASPDGDLSHWEKDGTHSDGKTIIYRPNLDSSQEKIIQEIGDKL